MIILGSELLFGAAVAGLTFALVRSKAFRATIVAIATAAIGQALGEAFFHVDVSNIVDGTLLTVPPTAILGAILGAIVGTVFRRTTQRNGN